MATDYRLFEDVYDLINIVVPYLFLFLSREALRLRIHRCLLFLYLYYQ